MPLTATRSPRNRARVRGAVSVEYIVLVGSVAIAIGVSLVAFGPSFVRHYEITRDLALVPAP